MSWQNGPLPDHTYGWGAVVPQDHEGPGFYFADFKGNKVTLISNKGVERTIKPYEVKFYDNSIESPAK